MLEPDELALKQGENEKLEPGIGANPLGWNRIEGSYRQGSQALPRDYNTEAGWYTISYT